MLTRQTGKGTVMEASERLSREEALQTYTEYGAYSQKAEGVKGRLVPGQWADIAVFDNDLLAAPARNHPFGHKLRADPACGPRRA